MALKIYKKNRVCENGDIQLKLERNASGDICVHAYDSEGAGLIDGWILSITPKRGVKLFLGLNDNVGVATDEDGYALMEKE